MDLVQRVMVEDKKSSNATIAFLLPPPRTPFT